MWDHRNHILFETDKADKMSGLGQLKAAINREIQLRSQDLNKAFHPYLTVTTKTLTKMKPISLQRRFSMIRQAREEAGYQYNDNFVASPAL